MKMKAAFIISILVSAADSSTFADVARGGQAEMLVGMMALESYLNKSNEEGNDLMILANKCRHDYLTTGIAHVPNFIRREVVEQMVKEASWLHRHHHCFRSTESHTVYQEPQDSSFPNSHPRNILQKSMKWIVDWDRLHQLPTGRSLSPLYLLYTSPELRAFVSYVVRPRSDSEVELFESGCSYNSAYYNIYEAQDGLGWHFDRSEFGVNLELQPAEDGGDFELCWNTRESAKSINDSFDKVHSILEKSKYTDCSGAQRIQNPAVGPGSLVFFAGSRNLHRVTPVGKASKKPRINAIMTYETSPSQRPNPYSLKKFFGR